jgi:hypothetical protein
VHRHRVVVLVLGICIAGMLSRWFGFEPAGWLTIFTVLVLYPLPVIIAFGRGHPRTLAIAVCSVLFGWTLASWLAGFVWSLRPIHELAPEPASERGHALPTHP